MILLTVLCRTLLLLIEALQLLMLVRAVMSWFPPSSGRPGPIRAFVTGVTEMVIAPVRLLLDRFDFVRRSPIDIAFLVTFLLLSAASTFLPLV